jgi:hypothetical protein
MHNATLHEPYANYKERLKKEKTYTSFFGSDITGLQRP